MSDDLSPYAPEQLDELLSAEIDGELAEAARDLGVTVDEVSARLRVTPGADNRRAALTAARDLMAEPPEIDELLAQRLQAKAIRVAVDEHAARELDRRRRRRQLLLGAGGIAAAAVAVVAIAGGLNSNGAKTNSASEKPAAAAPAPKHRSLQTVALGAFTDQHALATQAVNRSTSYATAGRGAADRFAPAATNAPVARVAQGALAPSTTASPVLGAAQNKSAGKATDPGKSLEFAAAACPTPAPVRPGDQLVLRATATLSGKPVIVFVYAGPDEHSVRIENANCRLLNTQMLR